MLSCFIIQLPRNHRITFDQDDLYEDVAGYNDYDDGGDIFVFDPNNQSSPKWFDSTTDTTEYDEVTTNFDASVLRAQIKPLILNNVGRGVATNKAVRSKRYPAGLQYKK